MVTLLRNHPWVFPATNFTPRFLSCIRTKQGLVQVRRNFKVQIEFNATERNRSRERLLKRNIYLHTNKSQQFQVAEGEWKVAPAMSGGNTPTEIESSSGQSVSVVQVSIPNQPVQVQSVIQSHVQPSVIHATGQNVPTIQVVRVAPVEDDLSDDSDGKKRREILSRRPSYRKILNELSSPVSVSKIEEESNSSQSQDGDSQDAATNLTTNSVHYQQTPGTIQISADGSVAQGLQMLTMTNASPNSTTAVTAGATIVQYATGPDGQQFYIPVGSTGTVQAYQIATSGTLPQGVVMATTGSSIGSPQQLGEEAARKRELRLLKNREAAKECRRKKKEYVKCLENRVAVLENQNKTLIEELKALKELYCQKEG